MRAGSGTSANLVATVYDRCFGPEASPADCVAVVDATQNAPCWRCIETSTRAATAYGPVVVSAGGVVSANVAGCVELQGPGSLTCAKALQATAECDLAACQANCPVVSPGDAGASLAAYDACTALAELGGCQAFVAAAATACAATDAGALAACSATGGGDGGSFRTFYDFAVPLFCQAPGVDASSVDAHADGGDDAGPVDASSAVDAGLGDGGYGDGSYGDGSYGDGSYGDGSYGD